MIEPHGGTLVERVLDSGTRDKINDSASEYIQLKVNPETAIDLKNIAFGTLSPLEGFLNENEFNCVLDHSRLPNDVPWTIPIILDVDAGFKERIKAGDTILLSSDDDTILARMEIGDIFPYDKKQYAQSVFQTTDPNHPGVEKVMGRNEFLLGGKIDLVTEVKGPLAKYNLKPKETRVLFHKKGWKSVVAFQTRNVPHLGHEYIQKASLNVVDGLLINPVIGKKKPGDFLDNVIIAAYETLIDNYYVKESCVLSTYETEMHYAGPKEAIHHSIARKNLGCTHFIVGRDHAGVGNYYGPFDAHKIFDQFPDLGIEPICFRSFFKCTKCNSVVSDRVCPHGNEFQVNFKGRVVRKMLSEGKVPQEEMRPEVAETIIQFGDLFVK